MKRSTPIIRWRWRSVGASNVLHAVEPGRSIEGYVEYFAACGLEGAEAVLEPNGEERCVRCAARILGR